jgi:hypothetical protein
LNLLFSLVLSLACSFVLGSYVYDREYSFV